MFFLKLKKRVRVIFILLGLKCFDFRFLWLPECFATTLWKLMGIKIKNTKYEMHPNA